MAAGNLTAVLFTLALIYGGLLYLCIVRTYKKIFGKAEHEYQRVFKAFYIFIVITLVLTIALYSTISTKLFSYESDNLTVTFGLIVFYFLPTIFMVLCFSLMYKQLEWLMQMSRISGSDERRSAVKNKKVALVMRIVVFTVVAIFVVT